MVNSSSETMDDGKCDARRPQFGARLLQSTSDVFAHNAWDQVSWHEEQRSQAEHTVRAAHEGKMSREDAGRCGAGSQEAWQRFYETHSDKFFQDRHWLFTEFAELRGRSARAETNVCEEKQHGDEAAAVCKNDCLDLDERKDRQESESISGEQEEERISASPLKDFEDDAEVSSNCDIFCDSCASFVGESASWRVWEVGCGAGNTVFPLLSAAPCTDDHNSHDHQPAVEEQRDGDLFVYASDFSERAVEIVRGSPLYDESRCHAFVHDIAAAAQPRALPFPEASIDCALLVFVLSAVPRASHAAVMRRVARSLRPGGWLLFRDYGRHDLAQLRFKPGRCLGEHVYVRGDGTLVHFFSVRDVERLAAAAGLQRVQCVEDRRLQVNRARRLTMYRVWVQAKFRKPPGEQHLAFS